MLCGFVRQNRTERPHSRELPVIQVPPGVERELLRWNHNLAYDKTGQKMELNESFRSWKNLTTAFLWEIHDINFTI